MIEISTPDGSSFSFPDGTPQDTISSAMDSHFGGAKASQPTLGSEAHAVAGGAVRGLGGLGDVREAVAGAPAWIAKTLGFDVSPENEEMAQKVTSMGLRAVPFLGGPTGKQMQQRVEGVTGTEFPEPQTTPGKFATTAAEFATNPTSYVGPGGPAVKAATAITGGLGSELGGQLTKGTSAEGIGRFIGAMLGATVLTTAARALPGARPQPRVTATNVGQAADRDYATVDSLGVEIKPQAVHGGLTRIISELDHAFDEDLAPKVFKVLNRDAGQYAAAKPDAMAALTGTKVAERAPVTMDDISSLRRRLGTIAQGNDATEAAAAKIAQRRLDDLVAEVNPADVIKGDATALAQTAKSARDNYAASMRHEAFSNVIQRAEDQAAAAGSGANVQNALRQQTKAFIRPDARGASPASMAGFNEQEIAALREFVGGGGGNKTRVVGNLLGGGGGLGASVASFGGHAVLGPAGFAIPAVGAAVKQLGNARALNRANDILDVILARSPEAAKAAGKAPAAAETIRGAAIRSKEGQVFEGTTHGDAATNLFGAKHQLSPTEAGDGFVTSTGRFVDRAEATKIALRAKQTYDPEFALNRGSEAQIHARDLRPIEAPPPAAPAAPETYTFANMAPDGFAGRAALNPYVQAYLRSQARSPLRVRVGTASGAAGRAVTPATGSYYQGTD